MIDLEAKNHMTLVEITPPDFDVELYIAYATSSNFTGKPVYGRPGCYLHPDAAERIGTAIDLAGRDVVLARQGQLVEALIVAEVQVDLGAHEPVFFPLELAS